MRATVALLYYVICYVRLGGDVLATLAGDPQGRTAIDGGVGWVSFPSLSSGCQQQCGNRGCRKATPCSVCGVCVRVCVCTCVLCLCLHVACNDMRSTIILLQNIITSLNFINNSQVCLNLPFMVQQGAFLQVTPAAVTLAAVVEAVTVIPFAMV